MSNNKLMTVDDCAHLCDCPCISCLDLSRNKLEDPAIIDEVFAHMPNLKVLKLDGNPFVRKIQPYRKSVLARLPHLTYLDDRPVFEDERRAVTAWALGGIEAERAERDKMREEQAEKDRANMRFLDELAEKGRAARQAAEEEASAQRAAQAQHTDGNDNFPSLQDKRATAWILAGSVQSF